MRARNIKPGFFKNESLGEISPLARLLFIGLWCMADREGLLEYRPKRIQVEILPYDSVNVEKLLEELRKSPEPFIRRFKEGEKEYLYIPNFKKHQSPHKNEKGSDYPAFTESREITGQLREKHPSTRPDSLIEDSLIEDSLIEDSLIEERGGSSERSKEPPEPAILKIILNCKSLHPITQQDIDDWQELFPAVDVVQELRKMAAWADANPRKRKTKHGIRSFVVKWLSKEQDKGHKIPAVEESKPHRPLVGGYVVK